MGETMIAERTLTVVHDGQERPERIQIMQPEQVGRSWNCRHTIDWPDAPIESFCGGNDAVAARHGAILKVGMELHMSRYHHERTMWWIKPWIGYGFLLPKGARDELIGDDQRFYGLDTP